MSHQGRYQDNADLELIRRYPEIFPNFYLIPAPHLDRKGLIELREFALIAVERFRWLLCALDRTTTDFLAFFEEWRAHRTSLRPALPGSDLRHYYRTEQFRDDFLAFTRGHQLGGTKMVAALLDYHEAVRSSKRKEPEAPAESAVRAGSRLHWTDIPVWAKHTRVVELSFDLQLLIDALKHGGAPIWKRGQHFYATREFSPGVDRLHRVSTWVGRLLLACDGRRTVREVVEHLTLEIVEVEESEREYVGVRLMEGVHARGWIDIYRRKSGSNRQASCLRRSA